MRDPGPAGSLPLPQSWDSERPLRLLPGRQIARQGAANNDGAATTSLDLCAILNLKAPFRVLASAGPAFADAGGATGIHAFVALLRKGAGDFRVLAVLGRIVGHLRRFDGAIWQGRR